MANNTYEVEYAKTGRSGCKNKKCELGKVIDAGSVRIGKVHPSPFSEGDTMADWYHPACFFDAMMRALAKTPVPMSPEDIKGWEDLRPEDEAALQPLLDEFVVNRKAKLAGTLPKKPKAPKASSTASSHTAPKSSSSTTADWLSSSSPSAPSKKAPPASKPSPTDKFGLSSMLDTRWHPILSPLIEALPGVEPMLSTFSPNFPNKARLFESLHGLDPSVTKLIVIKDRTFVSASAASGYVFNNTGDKTLGSANPQLSGLLKAARSFTTTQGNSVDWETYSTTAPSAWFEAMKGQGVLFLHRELSVDPSTAHVSSSWDAVVLKIVKSILSARSKANSGGLVMALFGENLDQLKRSIQRIYTRFQDKVPLRLATFPNPEDSAFLEAPENPLETIDSFLLETENDSLNWFPVAPAASSAKSQPSASTSTSYPPAPVLSGKMTSRVQLTSMDGKADLDIGKLHRDPTQKGTFLLRAVDIDASDDTLSNKIGTFTMGDKASISFTPLATNPVFYCASGNDHGAGPSALTTGKTITVQRGDLLSFSGDRNTYRIDPYNFSNPPANRYHPPGPDAGDIKSSLGDEDGDELGPREKDAKRSAADIEDDEDDALSKPPASKKSKLEPPKKSAAVKKKKNVEMDWMDEDVDEFADDDMEPGDGDWKPSKDDVRPDDYIIDEGEDKNSDDEDAEAAFFADKRPLCMYGSSCYRTNPAHLAQFRHPPKPT